MNDIHPMGVSLTRVARITRYVVMTSVVHNLKDPWNERLKSLLHYKGAG
jgi:hypothetical protein